MFKIPLLLRGLAPPQIQANPKHTLIARHLLQSLTRNAMLLARVTPITTVAREIDSRGIHTLQTQSNGAFLPAMQQEHILYSSVALSSHSSPTKPLPEKSLLWKNLEQESRMELVPTNWTCLRSAISITLGEP